MKRYSLSWLGALLVAAGTASAQTNAMTPVSSTQLYMNGSIIGTGKATITPVDARGTAIPIVTAAGRWYFGGLSATITNGVIASGFSVPDQCTAAATTPNTPINYQVQISAVVSPTSMPTTSYVIPATAPAVCGSTSFALDSYVPTQSATVSPAGLITGATPPTHCTAPSIYYLPTPGVPVSRCYNGVFVQDNPSGGGSSINWRGAYAGANSYAIGDAVSLNGSSYLALLASSSSNQQNPATATTYWALLAQAGAPGATGAAGANGATGAAGTAATIAIGTVTALGAGATPTATNAGTPNAAIINLELPVGPASVLSDTKLRRAALCSSGSAAPSSFGTYDNNMPGLGCFNPASSPLGYMAFYQADTVARFAVDTFLAPPFFTNADLTIVWRAPAATTGTVTWNVAYSCSANPSAPTYNTAVPVTSTPSGTAGVVVNAAVLTNFVVSGTNGCGALSNVYYTISRGIADGLSDEADLIGAILTVRRSQ
jgi:hypothetical protein